MSKSTIADMLNNPTTIRFSGKYGTAFELEFDDNTKIHLANFYKATYK